MPRPPHIVFAGGGTTGFLHPGLAIATHLRERDPTARITFVGTGKAYERHPVRASGFDYLAIPSQPVPRNPFHAMRFITDNVAGYWASRWFLREHAVSLVVGLGGYACAATVRAAMSRDIPTVLLEQNAVPTHVTRWLARSTHFVCAGFDEIRPHLPANTPLVTTGNPARPAFEQMYRSQRAAASKDHGLKLHELENPAAPISGLPTSRPRRLVVLGGVGGARSLNEFMPRALLKLNDRFRGWQIVHQTGEGQLQQTIDRYRNVRVDALVVSYIDELAPVLFESDLVVCRAGGTTLAELALAGVPAVLVPYARDFETYQLANADIAAAAGGATVIEEAALEGPLDVALVEHLAPLANDEARRAEMAAGMRTLACPDAADRVTDTIRSILGAGTGSIRRVA